MKRWNEFLKRESDLDYEEVIELPDEKAKTKFTDWLDKNLKYQKTIDEIRIRPEK